MTIIVFGTSFSSSAPVEVTMRFSSTVTPGSGVDSEPVAITMVFALISLPSTATTPGALIVPWPWRWSILCFLNRKATPLVS